MFKTKLKIFSIKSYSVIPLRGHCRQQFSETDNTKPVCTKLGVFTSISRACTLKKKKTYS